MRGLRALGFCLLTVLPGLAVAADGQPVTIASISDFPNCPAPAVNGLNLRVSRDADGTRLRAFIVVQNVGNRAFLAPSGDAVVRVTMGDEALGAFAIERLAPSEVRHLAIETLLPPLTEPADITARIDFGAGLPTGKVAATFDCQLSDNAVIRDGASIRATLDRIAG
jgi:hypothetical protein